MYLIDTDWAVDYLKGVNEKVEFLQEQEDLYISAISVGELIEGIEDSERKEERRKALEDFLSGVKILAVTKEIAVEFGKIRNNLRQEGELIGDIDVIIGATAKTNNLTILTDNQKHFSKIENIDLHES